MYQASVVLGALNTTQATQVRPKVGRYTDKASDGTPPTNTKELMKAIPGRIRKDTGY